MMVWALYGAVFIVGLASLSSASVYPQYCFSFLLKICIWMSFFRSFIRVENLKQWTLSRNDTADYDADNMAILTWQWMADLRFEVVLARKTNHRWWAFDPDKTTERTAWEKDADDNNGDQDDQSMVLVDIRPLSPSRVLFGHQLL